ncbi:putative disease resistance protein At3g14460 [Hibiscus syriacus]|uniref:putative disease resistance protein At3g14460 n=1 Tax=Hibiscus syriacus TaxID=106335 RepID=UPI001920C0C2|nr:putative disease resistance protein At3g14460 [Hibiscus syriacus]
MENLVNLCHLDISGADRLQGMENNFSTLTNLQTLALFVLGKEKGYQIRELKDLSNLKGQLHISGLQNVVEPRDAWMAKLHDKSRIEKLELSWSKDFKKRTQEDERKVLDGLQPSKMLKELTISFYCGATLATWVGDSFLNDLQSLFLDDCPNLLSLPSIGKLPLLKKVRIKGLERVTSVGAELFGENAPCAFPSLEILQFEDMPKWEKWNLREVDEKAKKFPRLGELVIQKCPLLSGSIPEHLPSLEKLMIHDCEKLTISIQSFPVLSEIKIQRCHEVVYKGFGGDSSLKRVSFSGISKFSCAPESLRLRSIKVESLEIDNCEELCSFHENNWRWLTQSMSLRILKIRKFQRLVSIGADDETEVSMQLKIPYNIEQMTIKSCERLEKLSLTLHCLRSVWMIELYSCPKLISLGRSNLPLNLKVLKVYTCRNLQSLLLDEEENVNSKNACVLQQLDIYSCRSLKRINRSELPSTLKELGINGCSKLESIAQQLQDNSSLESISIFWCDMIKDLPQRLNKLRHLQCIYIEHCSNLVSFPESGLPTTSLKVFRLANCEQLQALPQNMHCLNSLEELEISDCPNVTSLPEQGIPTNLRSLKIRGPNICKPIMEWGLHRLTSLRSLWVSNGCAEAVSFPQDEIGMTLPSSLTRLEVWNFPKLEVLSSNGFRNLTSVESLIIIDCPNLRFLPEKNMLSSLLRLYISSGVLEERCKGDNISHVPFVSISS